MANVKSEISDVPTMDLVQAMHQVSLHAPVQSVPTNMSLSSSQLDSVQEVTPAMPAMPPTPAMDLVSAWDQLMKMNYLSEQESFLCWAVLGAWLDDTGLFDKSILKKTILFSSNGTRGDVLQTRLTSILNRYSNQVSRIHVTRHESVFAMWASGDARAWICDLDTSQCKYKMVMANWANVLRQWIDGVMMDVHQMYAPTKRMHVDARGLLFDKVSSDGGLSFSQCELYTALGDRVTALNLDVIPLDVWQCMYLGYGEHMTAFKHKAQQAWYAYIDVSNQIEKLKKKRSCAHEASDVNSNLHFFIHSKIVSLFNAYNG
jgi:hypothetical protein